MPVSDYRRDAHAAWAWRIVNALRTRYVAPIESSKALPLHAVYHMPNNVGVDEACILGDYFYLEALIRLRNVWAPYWR